MRQANSRMSSPLTYLLIGGDSGTLNPHRSDLSDRNNIPVEASMGFEPTNTSFADKCLKPLGYDAWYLRWESNPQALTSNTF